MHTPDRITTIPGVSRRTNVRGRRCCHLRTLDHTRRALQQVTNLGRTHSRTMSTTARSKRRHCCSISSRVAAPQTDLKLHRLRSRVKLDRTRTASLRCSLRGQRWPLQYRYCHRSVRNMCVSRKACRLHLEAQGNHETSGDLNPLGMTSKCLTLLKRPCNPSARSPQMAHRWRLLPTSTALGKSAQTLP